MRIINFRAFNGKNIYSHKKCIRMDVDLEGYCETPSKDIKNFNETVVKLIPELREHRCGIDEDGGFLKRLREGTYLAHISEHIIIALHNRIGVDIKYGKAREIQGDRYYVIFQYEYKNSSIEIATLAVDIINSIINNISINMDTRIENIEELYDIERLGSSTSAIIEEAKKSRIPVTRIGERSLFQLGYGKSGKLVEATIGWNTSAISVDIACDKLLTKEILFRQSLPVARGGKARNSLEVLLEASNIGYPVVLKPRYGNQGKGVFVNIKDEKELIDVYKNLKEDYEEIIIEKYITGKDFRVCVVDGEVIAVSERIPPYIIGDGKNTISQLVQIINSDKMRGNGHEKPLTKIVIDDKLTSYVKSKGYDMSSVLEKDKKLYLRLTANLSTGGTAVDCTDEICEENKHVCVKAAKAIGLDICGIDLCCKDISEPVWNTGAIIEVNAAPGIRMHHYPYKGKSRNVARAIVRMLTKECKNQIPLVAITGTNGKTTTTRIIGHTLQKNGLTVGMTTTGGIYINDRCIETGDTTGYESAMSVLLNREVEAAVLETARGGIIKKGLAYDVADVAVITNITEDHLGIDEVETMDDLAKVKALVGEAVKKDGYVVLNADDAMSMSIIHRIKSKIIMFSKDNKNEYLRKNIQLGGFGVYLDHGFICVEKEEEICPIIKVNDVKITLNGGLIYNVENAMAACAALIGLNVDYDIIEEGLSTFYGDDKQNAGRFNTYDLNGVTVVLDYGHNIEGYKAVLSGVKNLKYKRLVGIVGVPGDRTDSSTIEVGRICGANFDVIYVKEDEDRRGRKPLETADLLIEGIKKNEFKEDNLSIVLDEEEALRIALDNSKKGDLIIVFFDKFKPLIETINNRKINNPITKIKKEA